MKRLLVFIFSLILTGNVWAADNAVVVTTGSGLTLRSRDVGAGVQSLQQILGDTSGNAIYGTAGTANANVLTIQGIASGTVVPITGTITAVTAITNALPAGNNVIGHVIVDTTSTTAVTQPTASNLNATVVGTGTFVTQSTLAAETTKVIGTIRTLGNAGAIVDFAGQAITAPANSWLVGATFFTTPTTLTNGQASPLQMDSAGNLLVNIKTGSSSGAVAQGSTTSGQIGLLIQGAVTTAAPSYTTAQTSPLSLDTTGNLRVNVVTATGLAQGSTTSGQTASLILGAVTTASPSYTTAQSSPLSLDTAGSLRVAIVSGAGSGGTAIADGATFTEATTSFTPIGGEYVSGGGASCTTGKGCTLQMTIDRMAYTNLGKVNAVAVLTGTGAVGTGAQRIAVGTDTATIAGSAPGIAGTASSNVVTVQGIASMTKLLVTPDSVALPANQSVNVSQINAVTPLMGNGVTGTGSQRVTIASDNTAFSVNVGTLPSNASVNVAQFGGVSTSTGQVAVSTAPVTATNTALVVDLRPDSPGIIALGQTTKSASVPVTIASDQLGANTAANSLPITIGPALLGSYCMGANTGTMAAGLAGGSPVYSFRYGGANLAIVRKVSAEADDITTAFVAGAAKFDLFAARSFSASDTGGTAATLTGNNGKLRTSFATTAISDLRISSTATLTAGTRTLDAQPLASVEFAVATSIDAGLLPTTDLIRQNVGESPLVLANNEGFVIQATVPGTGTWVAAVRTCWDEVSAF